MRVMVIGASTHRDKFGNKAVRAYQRQGHDVLPVHPTAKSIEGTPAYADVRDVPGPTDRATLYLPPEKGLPVIEQLAERGDVRELWVNPGAESPPLIDKAKQLGFEVIQACSIVDIGETP
ncbi:MAG: CoA-binding protein [Phycisphaeraceae bacterium]